MTSRGALVDLARHRSRFSLGSSRRSYRRRSFRYERLLYHRYFVLLGNFLITP